MSVEIERTTRTLFKVQAAASGNRLTVSHLLWFAREAQEAVDAGMDPKAEVHIDNPTGVNGITVRATHVHTQEIP